MLTSARSLTTTATRFPSRFSRTCFSVVVFPAPRNPDSSVRGTCAAHAHGCYVGGRVWGGCRARCKDARARILSIASETSDGFKSRTPHQLAHAADLERVLQDVDLRERAAVTVAVEVVQGDEGVALPLGRRVVTSRHFASEDETRPLWATAFWGHRGLRESESG